MAKPCVSTFHAAAFKTLIHTNGHRVKVLSYTELPEIIVINALTLTHTTDGPMQTYRALRT